MASATERAKRIVVMLEVVPHRDEIEAPDVEGLIAEQAAAKVDSVQRRIGAQIREVDARRTHSVARSHLLEERSYRTPDVEHLARCVERHEFRNKCVLLPVVSVHHPGEESAQHTPIAL